MNIFDEIKNNKNAIIGNGATSQQIIDSEDILGLKFADDYTQYLKNFGALMLNGHSLTGISKATQLDVVKVTEHERKLIDTLHYDMYVIEELDEAVIWQNQKGEIYKSVNGNFVHNCSSFFEYIECYVLH